MFEDEYLETRVMTASAAQLHLMVVDGALRFAAQAQEALEQKDFETGHNALGRAREFIGELLSGVNLETNAEIGANLRALFQFAFRELALADCLQDATHVANARKVLLLHRETWLQVLTGPQSEAGPATTDAVA